jgi:hypothetical protein
MEEPIRLSTQELLIYGTLINAAVGLFLGLIPLCFGFFLGKRNLGIMGIVGSTLGGAMLGIYLTFPIIAIFMWLIIENKAARIGISAVVTAVGIFLAVFAYIRSQSGSNDGFEIPGVQDPIFLALMIGGVIFTLVGLILFVLSLLRQSEVTTDSVPIE